MRNITIVDRAQTSIQKMIERFDTDRGCHYYSRRMGTVEPVFANITSTLGLNRFSLRGRVKVDTQWKLYCGLVREPYTMSGGSPGTGEGDEALQATEPPFGSDHPVVAQRCLPTNSETLVSTGNPTGSTVA